MDYTEPVEVQRKELVPPSWNKTETKKYRSPTRTSKDRTWPTDTSVLNEGASSLIRPPTWTSTKEFDKLGENDALAYLSARSPQKFRSYLESTVFRSTDSIPNEDFVMPKQIASHSGLVQGAKSYDENDDDSLMVDVDRYKQYLSTGIDVMSSLDTEKSNQKDTFRLKQMTLEISPPRLPLDVLETSNMSEDIRQHLSMKKHTHGDLNTSTASTDTARHDQSVHSRTDESVDSSGYVKVTRGSESEIFSEEESDRPPPYRHQDAAVPISPWERTGGAKLVSN
jgi:hypothetical protein